MLFPCRIEVIAGVADFNELFAIYTLKDADGAIRFVGVTRLSHLFEFEDARNNSEWANVFGKPLATIDINVTALTTNEREAYAEQRRLITMYQPHCNLKGFYQAAKYQSVICNETQEVFPNAAQCAKAHQIDASALGNHLKQRPGFKTVKGRTYSYHVRKTNRPIG